MDRLLIEKATVVTMNDDRRIYSPGYVGIQGKRIAHVGARPPAGGDWTSAPRLDGTDRIAIPGLINAHTHTGMTVMRGAADDLPLMEWLQTRIWPMEARMRSEDTYWGSKLAALEMLRGGVTCLVDMYWHSEATARACRETGIRALLAGVLIGIHADPEGQLARAVETVREWNQRNHDRIRFLFGPHAQYTCPDRYLERIVQYATDLDTGIHIHLSETEEEVRQCRQERQGQSPVAVLDEIGVFSRPTLAAHCIHLLPGDREILGRQGVHAIHNPSSNMKLAAGFMDVTGLLEQGINVALGTDSAASNNNLSILQEMRLAALLEKVKRGDPGALPAGRVLEMATRNAARAIGMAATLGQLTPGFLADLVLIRTDRLHALPLSDPVSHLVYSLRADDVDTVLVAGEILVRDGIPLGQDLQELRRRTQEIIDRIRI